MRDFELEKLRIESATDRGLSSPQSTGNSIRRSTFDIQRLMPKFNPEETDVSLFLAMFELQVKHAQVDELDWVSQILALLPLEIGQIILRESEENSKDYNFVKQLLLDRFRLSPEAFRQKFTQHSRRPNCLWKDFAYELQNYLEGWLKGLEITNFETLKQLMIADQMKRRVGSEAREHFLDDWGEITSPFELAGKLDHFESVRRHVRKPISAGKMGPQEKRLVEFKNQADTKERLYKQEERPSASFGRYQENTKVKDFERRKPIRCYVCNSPDHLRPNCPERKSKDLETCNHLELNRRVDECLEPYTSEALVNGHRLPVLRDTGATIDLICEKNVPSETYTGEVIWIKQPLDIQARRLPVATVKLRGDFGQIITKAGVYGKELDQGRYLLGNRTALLIKESLKSKKNTQITNAKARSPVKLGKQILNTQLGEDIPVRDSHDRGQTKLVRNKEDPNPVILCEGEKKFKSLSEKTTPEGKNVIAEQVTECKKIVGQTTGSTTENWNDVSIPFATNNTTGVVKIRDPCAREAKIPDELSVMPGGIELVPEIQSSEPSCLGSNGPEMKGWVPEAPAELEDTPDFFTNSATALAAPKETVPRVGTEMKSTLEGISEVPEHGTEATTDVTKVIRDVLQLSENSSLTPLVKTTLAEISLETTSPVPVQGQNMPDELQAQPPRTRLAIIDPKARKDVLGKVIDGKNFSRPQKRKKKRKRIKNSNQLSA